MITREFFVEADSGAVPVVLWTPPGPQVQRPLLLVGHGGSAHKTHPAVVEVASRFVVRHRFAVAAIDGPIHGARRAHGMQGPAMQAAFLAMWRTDPQIDRMVADWRAALDALVALKGASYGAIGWYGVSMGTAYGLPYIAAEPRINVAVLGMWGGDFANSGRLRDDAPRVHCPVLFQQKWDDQLFTRQGQLDLFDRIGSAEKWLKVYPGEHVPVAGEQADDADRFLASRLSRLLEPPRVDR